MASSKLVESIIKLIENGKSFDSILKGIKILHIGGGHCTAEFKVDRHSTNVNGTMHGGFAATLIDAITTYALFSLDKQNTVSVDLHVTFLKAAKLGGEIIIDGRTLKAGKSLAFVECEIKDKPSGDILVKGLHTKYIMSSTKKEGKKEDKKEKK